MMIHIELTHQCGFVAFDVDISISDLNKLHKICTSAQQLKWKLYDLWKEQEEERDNIQKRRELDEYVNLLKTLGEV